MANAQKQFMYVGSYARQEDPGISVYSLNPDSAELTLIEGVSGIENPSFLAFNSTKTRLYAVSETHTFQGHKGGSVAAFAIDPQTRRLRFLNQQPTTGEDSCHLSVDRTDSTLLVANYSGSSVAVFALNADGTIGELTQAIHYEGKGINPARQEKPHPHSVFLDAAEAYAFVPDLGRDLVISYRLDAHSHHLIPHQETSVQPGAGPRHLAFHPSGRYAYVINELNSTVTAFAYTPESGSLQTLQSISTLPADFTGESTCADIHVHPSGLFLYGSNRGHDSIAVFRLDPATGLLSSVEYSSTLGKTPRNFALAPDGRFLFVANQDTDTLVTYHIDPSTGQLTPLETTVPTSKPVCIKILREE